MNSFIKKHLILIIIVFILANSTAYYLFISKGAACMDQAQIDSDSRCLYVYNGNVYQKGSKNNPHQGVACGRNVDSIIPSLHFSGGTLNSFNNAKITTFCASGATTTPSPSPTPTPTKSPSPAPTKSPTPTPTNASTKPNWDVDENGTINIIDIGIVVDQYGKLVLTKPRADVDKNGKVNIIDIGIIVDHLQ